MCIMIYAEQIKIINPPSPRPSSPSTTTDEGAALPFPPASFLRVSGGRRDLDGRQALLTFPLPTPPTSPAKSPTHRSHIVSVFAGGFRVAYPPDTEKAGGRLISDIANRVFGWGVGAWCGAIGCGVEWGFLMLLVEFEVLGWSLCLVDWIGFWMVEEDCIVRHR